MTVFPTEAHRRKHETRSSTLPVRVALASPFTIPFAVAFPPSATLFELRIIATSLAHWFVCITYSTKKCVCQVLFCIFSEFFRNFFQFCLRAGILSLPPRAFWRPKTALRAYNLTNARHVIFCAYIVLQHPFPPVFYKTEDLDRQILRPSSPHLLRSRVRGPKKSARRAGGLYVFVLSTKITW